jgi:GrpB-like predicted nucleotidyltransferase (UPF0157 family)
MISGLPIDKGPAVILEYPIEKPSFIEWTPVCLEVAERIIQYIQKKSEAIEIHHVGSTSITDCGGKGSIDLAVVYTDGQLGQTREIIDRLGFQKQKTRDPFPETRPMRTGAIDHAGQLYKIHIHILSKESDEFAEMIRFRDWLRTNDSSRVQYIGLKRRILEAGVSDSVEYSELKGAFFQ